MKLWQDHASRDVRFGKRVLTGKHGINVQLIDVCDLYGKV